MSVPLRFKFVCVFFNSSFFCASFLNASDWPQFNCQHQLISPPLTVLFWAPPSPHPCSFFHLHSSPYLPFLPSVFLFRHYLLSREGAPHIKALCNHPFWDDQQLWDNWMLLEVPLKPTVSLSQEKSINKEGKSDRLVAWSKGRAMLARNSEWWHAYQCCPCKVNKDS